DFVLHSKCFPVVAVSAETMLGDTPSAASRQRLATLFMRSLHWIDAESLPPDRPLLVNPYGAPEAKIHDFFAGCRTPPTSLQADDGRYDRIVAQAVVPGLRSTLAVAAIVTASGAAALGQMATADRVQSAGFWPTKGAAPRADYLGPAACARCHAAHA